METSLNSLMVKVLFFYFSYPSDITSLNIFIYGNDKTKLHLEP
jgi:hypothetical protein